MATLKEHQAAMVDLLANGSGIPASASRLAHALHDVLSLLTTEQLVEAADWRCLDATTPGLNDKAISKREKALKTDTPAKWPTPAEQRVKELENTIRQLKANLVHERAELKDMLGVDPAYYRVSEQAGCRKEDTQLPPAEIPCDHPEGRVDTNIGFCSKCGNFL